MSKDAHTVDGEAGTDRTEEIEAQEEGFSGGTSRSAVAKSASGPATRLAAAAGVAAIAAGGAVAAGSELLGEAEDPTTGPPSDQAAELLFTAVPALEALEDLLPDPPGAESDTADSTAGDTGRLRFEVVESPLVAAAAGGATALVRPRGVGAVAVAVESDGSSPPRGRTDGRSSQRRPERVEDPSEESSRERPGGPRSGVLGAPETSGGPEKPTPGDAEPDVANGMENPDPTATPDASTPDANAPEPETSATPDTQVPGATPESPGPEATDPSAAQPPESSSTAPEPGAESP